MTDRLSRSIFTIEVDGKATLAFEAKRYSEAEAICGDEGLLAKLSLLKSGEETAGERSRRRVFAASRVSIRRSPTIPNRILNMSHPVHDVLSWHLPSVDAHTNGRCRNGPRMDFLQPCQN